MDEQLLADATRTLEDIRAAARAGDERAQEWLRKHGIPLDDPAPESEEGDTLTAVIAEVNASGPRRRKRKNAAKRKQPVRPKYKGTLKGLKQQAAGRKKPLKGGKGKGGAGGGGG